MKNFLHRLKNRVINLGIVLTVGGSARHCAVGVGLGHAPPTPVRVFCIKPRHFCRYLGTTTPGKAGRVKLAVLLRRWRYRMKRPAVRRLSNDGAGCPRRRRPWRGRLHVHRIGHSVKNLTRSAR